MQKDDTLYPLCVAHVTSYYADGAGVLQIVPKIVGSCRTAIPSLHELTIP